MQRIGFHYHIPVNYSADGSLETQSFYGLFLDSLAEQCEELVLFAYLATELEKTSINYVLISKNVRVVSLGFHNSLPRRLCRFHNAYSLLVRESKRIDVLLVRSPTPLVMMLPLLKNRMSIVLYLVGDYVEGARSLSFNFFKNTLIRFMARAVETAQKKLVRGSPMMANSLVLIEQYKHLASKVYLIKTTTLNLDDFYFKESVTQQGAIKILYTGRLDEGKGLVEILEACQLLTVRGIPTEFHFAGLLVKGKESFPTDLLERSRGTAMKGKVFYHGLKKVGEELNGLYRSCDIYVVGSKSHFEGFPRTIWEAMANSLPVIASPMGSIPYFLRNGEDALLLNTVTAVDIAEKIEYLVDDPSLRSRLVTNGLALARENTLQGQAKKIAEVLNACLE